MLKTEEEANGLHAWPNSHFNSRKKEMEALDNASAVLHIWITKLTTRADSDRMKLQQKL